MDKQRWLVSNEPLEMLEFLRGKAGDRKLRLFAVSCTRRLWELLLDERSRNAIETSERYADGFANDEERNAAGLKGYDATAEAERAVRNAAGDTLQQGRYAAYFNAASCAYHAGYCDDWGDVRTVCEASVRACLMGDSPLGEDAERFVQCQMLRDLFANPFHPLAISSYVQAWNASTILRLAQAAYDERILPAGTLDNTRLLILADALEEAGCSDEQMLGHLRNGGDHYRGCFVLDALLGKS